MSELGDVSGKAPPPLPPPPSPVNFFRVDFVLRVLLFALALSSLVVLVTSKESKTIPTGLPAPFSFVNRDAKFNYSPAFIYLLVALAATCLYAIVTIVSSLSLIPKHAPPTAALFTLILCDVLMAGIMAAATGTAGGVAYIGHKGNSHSGWKKICGVYGKYCRHIGSATALALASSLTLSFLIVVSAYSLYRRSR